MTDDLDRDDWNLAELLSASREAWLEEIHTAFPARVERYDADAQVADLKPMVRRALAREDGSLSREELPILRAVRVLHPRWGGWFIHASLAAGDSVLVICCERDFSRWLATGDVSDAPDVRLHHLAHAVALPVSFYPRARPIGDAGDDALVLGRDGGATVRVLPNGQVHVAGTEQLARAGNLDQHLSAIAAGLDALISAVTGGAVTAQPNYGSAAKGVLDSSAPIPTQNTRGS